MKTYQFEAKVTRKVYIAVHDEEGDLNEYSSMKYAIDILENGDGQESDECIYSDLKLARIDED